MQSVERYLAMTANLEVQWFINRCKMEFAQEEIIVKAPSKLAAEGLRRHAKELSYWALENRKKRVSVYFPGDGNRPYIFPSCLALEKITDLYLELDLVNTYNIKAAKKEVLEMIENTLIINANLLESFPLRGLVSDDWMRLAMSVHQEDKPCFLVSIDSHKNVIFNQAALDLLNATPEQMFVQSLPKLWVPQHEILPVDYERKVPSKLTDFNSHLRQQSKLESFVFENWRSNLGEGTATWTRWTDDIEYVELPGGSNARKMVVLGFESA